MGHLGRTRLTGRSGRSRQSQPVEADQQGLVGHSRKPEMRMLGCPDGVRGDRQAGNLLRKGRLEPSAGFAHILVKACSIRGRQFHGHCHSHRSQHVMGSRTTAQFLSSAMDDRLQGHAVPYIEHAHSGRSAELVSGQGQKVHPQFVHPELLRDERLHGVGVDERLRSGAIPDRLGDLLNRLAGAGLVVGRHHRDHRGMGGNGLRNLGGVDESVPIHPTRVTGQPHFLRKRTELSTASCSTAEVTTPLRFPPARAAPFTARLSDSVPPPVNTISRGRHPSSAATFSRASSNAFLAARAEE